MTGTGPPSLQTIPAAVAENVATVRKHTSAAIMAVVKADGYGHGALPVARSAVEAGAEWLGTTDINDAIRLLSAGLRVPLLSWLNSSGIDAEAASAHRIDIAVGSVDELEALIAAGAPQALRVHLHVDTGMAREGSVSTEWDALFLRALLAQRRGQITVAGLMGHLPNADYADPAHNEPAVRLMCEAKQHAAAVGIPTGLTHLAATAGALTDRSTHFDMVRIGAGLVGIDPSNTTFLQGASRLSAPIVHSATVPARTPIGYGGNHITSRTTRVSTVPLGYADGIPRELSLKAQVAINGRRYLIIGRVSMNQIIVDTGTDYFPLGTTVNIFGPSTDNAPTVQEWATWARTIPHTFVTNIGTRVKRTAT